jgi:protoheme IX farnesyltransferase
LIAVGAAATRQWGASVRAYFLLTKPRIIELLLVTTLPTMVLAEGGIPSFLAIVVTMVGGAMSAGGANAINCYVDRDIDQLMFRTRNRPLPAGSVQPERALVFGIALGVSSFVLMTFVVNPLAASLTLAGLLFYVFVYTLWLKRATVQNIVIGGAAGSMPPLVAWAAVRDEVSPAALILFATVFMWTPPHFWALALRFKEDYARASVPMLPVVKGERETRRQILLYALLLVPVSLSLALTGEVGWVYVAITGVAGAVFVAKCWTLWRGYTPRRASNVFRFSIAYLTIVFAALIADVAADAGLSHL